MQTGLLNYVSAYSKHHIRIGGWHILQCRKILFALFVSFSILFIVSFDPDEKYKYFFSLKPACTLLNL